MLKRRIFSSLAAFSTAVLLTVTFPPAGAAELGWVALAPLIVLCAYLPPREAFRWGWFAGFAAWLASISWLLRLVQTGGLLVAVVVGWLMLSAYCALYVGAFAYLVSRLLALAGTVASPPPPRDLLRRVAAVLVIPLLWVGLEYLRSTLFTGFAWNALGTSQYRNLAVVQIAELGGVYLISYAMAAVGAAIALTACRFIEYGRRRRKLGRTLELTTGLAICMAAMLGGLYLRRNYQREAPERACRIATVNPGIPQTEKWDEEQARNIEEQLTELTDKARAGEPALVVWPETCIPYAFKIDPATQAFVQSLARKGAPLIVGSIDMDDDGFRQLFYNSAFLVDTNGAIAGEYRKRHLVPFGEYMPFEGPLPFLSRLSPLGYSCTPGSTGTVFRLPVKDAPPVEFSVLICFEDTVAPLARDCVRSGARLLVNISNDAWFENTAAAAQHLSHSVLRCVENRVPGVRSVNLGASCFIDRSGAIDTISAQLLEQGEIEAPGYRTDEIAVQPAGRPLTMYTRFGDWLLGIPCGIATAVALAASLWHDRREARRGKCLTN